jgi:hypothetical protein
VTVECLGKRNRIVFVVNDIEPDERTQPSGCLGQTPFPGIAVEGSENPSLLDCGRSVGDTIKFVIPSDGRRVCAGHVRLSPDKSLG